MKITGRHLVITSALRQHIESRFERLVRYEVKLSHLEVILGVSKLQHQCGGRLYDARATDSGKSFDAGNVRDDRPARGPLGYSDTKTQGTPELIIKNRRSDRFARFCARLFVRREEEIEVVRPVRAVLTLEDAKRRLDPLPGSLVVFTALSSGKLQILQRLDRDRVVLIDP